MSLHFLKYTCAQSVLGSGPWGRQEKDEQDYRFRSPLCVLFFSFSLRSCLASLSFSLCSLSCSFFLWASSRSESRSSFRALRTSSTLVLRNRAQRVKGLGPVMQADPNHRTLPILSRCCVLNPFLSSPGITAQMVK